MNKLLLIALATVGFAASAHEGEVTPLWGCRVEATLSGHSTGVVLSVTDVEGTGTVRCVSTDGLTQETPVKLHLKGVGLGFGYADYTGVEIASGNIGLANPDAIVGSYSVGPSAGVTLIEAGIDVGVALKCSQHEGISFELALVGRHAHGLEAKVQLQKLVIEPAND
jgi:hypothetical protein